MTGCMIPYPSPVQSAPKASIALPWKTPTHSSPTQPSTSATRLTFRFKERMMLAMNSPGSMIARKNSEISTPENELSIL